MTREEAFNAKIRPLVQELVAACQEHGIALAAQFDISSTDDPNRRCTTILPGEDGGMPDDILAARALFVGALDVPDELYVALRADHEAASRVFH